MASNIVEWITTGRPDLAHVKKSFEEYWYLIRSLAPINFSAVIGHVDHIENNSQVLALILSGIAFYRFERDEVTDCLYFAEAWEVSKTGGRI